MLHTGEHEGDSPALAQRDRAAGGRVPGGGHRRRDRRQCSRSARRRDDRDHGERTPVDPFVLWLADPRHGWGGWRRGGGFDGASGQSAQNSALHGRFVIGMPFYALGGPATHWTHGDFQKGLISLGGNFALPVLGGFIGQGVGCAPSDAAVDCGNRGFLTGFGIALVTVPIIDALVLGWEDIPDDDPLVSSDPRAADVPAPRSHRRAREERAARSR